MRQAIVGYGKCWYCGVDRVIFKVFIEGMVVMFICKDCVPEFIKFLQSAVEGKMSP
jgi:hypothetical protein